MTPGLTFGVRNAIGPPKGTRKADWPPAATRP